jgi:hypothetical protein
MLAREVVRANKQRDRLVSSKARVGSVQMQLQNQLGESRAPFGIDDEAMDKVTDCSNGESHWGFPEEFGNHESYEPIDQITTIQRNNEGNEYGDDEGMSLYSFLTYLLSYGMT